MITAIIVAGGKGKRMGADINKQYIKLDGKEILAITLETFHKIDLIDEIVVVVSENEVEYCKKNIINKYKINKIRCVVPGGIERQQSVYNGLKNCSPDTDIVIIHDGARPFVETNVILKGIGCAKEYGACTAAVPSKDTIKVINEENEVVNTPNRRSLYSVQTPQTFKYDLILEAHEKCKRQNLIVTDDTMMVEAIGGKVKIVDGSYFNIKLTTPEDIIIGKAIIEYMHSKNDM